MTINTKTKNRLEAYTINALGFLFLPIAAMATAQTWVLAVAGVIAILGIRVVQGRVWFSSNHLLMILMSLLVGWAAISSSWSILTDRAVTTSIRLALVGVSLIILIDAAKQLDYAQRRTFGKWLIGGTVTGLVLTAAVIASSGILSSWFGETFVKGHELDSLNRTGSAVAMLVWPVALVFAQFYGRYAAAAVIAVSALTLFALSPTTPVVAFIIGICGFSIAWSSHRWGKRFLLLAFTGSVVMIPLLDILAPIVVDTLVANMASPNSEVHRIRIWEFAANRIFEHPIIGWGLDASRAIPGGHEKIHLFENVSGQAIPLHPHNALVQIWLELGIVGVILVGSIFSLLVASIPESATNHAGPAIMVATASCGFAIAQLGFGIWQGWWMATLGLMVMIIVVIVPRPGDTETSDA
jgi:exopolysaccharide production protein ExoQ